MQVKLSQAVKMFFGNFSLEMVYFEAIANALDAGANEITISINAKALNQPETLQIEISDNGSGFTDCWAEEKGDFTRRKHEGSYAAWEESEKINAIL